MHPTCQFFVQLLLRRTLLLLNVIPTFNKIKFAILFFLSDNTDSIVNINQEIFGIKFNHIYYELNKKSSLLVCNTSVRRNGSYIVALLLTPKIMQLLCKIDVRKCFLQLFCFYKIRVEKFFVLL